MRLWSIHPRYLDPQGLVALWRETLLAQKVLAGETKGYRNHPQLQRFKTHATPKTAMSFYLSAICDEAQKRNYQFDRSKIMAPTLKKEKAIPVTRGQRDYEFLHLKRKLKIRSPQKYNEIKSLKKLAVHPLFRVTAGPIEAWEKNESETTHFTRF
jgi:hypothetical protein